MSDPERIVAVYMRVSSDEQRERESIKNQVEAVDRRLESEPDIRLYEQFKDDGISGSRMMRDRPAGAVLLQAAMEQRFNELWITRLDRLGRDALDLLQIRALLLSLGIKLVGILEPIDDFVGFGFRAVMSQDERMRIRSRSEAGMNRAARDGRYTGGIVPLGYRVEGKNPHSRLAPSDALMWADLTEADVVRRMYHRLAVDGWSCVQLIAEMNALGIPTAYQKDGRGVRGRATQQIWRPNRAYCLITNTIYRGELRYGRHSKQPGGREIISAAAPRLVSDEIWYAAQASLRGHRLNPQGKRRLYLLRSKMVCGLCGMRYAGITSPGRDGTYRCNGQLVSRRPELGRCPGKLIKCKHVDEPIWADIERFLRDPGDLIDELVGEMNDAGGAAVHEAERMVLVTRLDDLFAQRKSVLDLKVRGRMTAEECDETLDRIESDRRQVELRLELISGEVVARPDLMRDDVLTDIRERLDGGLTDYERQQVASLLVRRVSVETTVHGPRNKTARISVDYSFPCVVQSHTGSRCTLRRPSPPCLPTTGSCAPFHRPAGSADHPRSAPLRTSAPASCTARSARSPVPDSCSPLPSRRSFAAPSCWATPYIALVRIEVNDSLSIVVPPGSLTPVRLARERLRQRTAPSARLAAVLLRAPSAPPRRSVQAHGRLAGERFPASQHDASIVRVEFHAIGDSPRPLGGDQRAA